MIIPACLIDTDIVSALMRQQPIAVSHAKAYLATHKCFTFSIITRYEILRGLRAKGATKQADIFEGFCARNRILPLTDDVICHAAEIYADLYRRGELIGDADVLIGATAIIHGLEIVTNNESHFRRITALKVRNWLIK